VVQDVFRAGPDGSVQRTRTVFGSRSLPVSLRGDACIDLLRKRSSAAVFREEIEAAELLGGPPGPAEIAQAAEGLRRAEVLLGRLPRSRPEAIRLRVFDGLGWARLPKSWAAR